MHVIVIYEVVTNVHVFALSGTTGMSK